MKIAAVCAYTRSRNTGMSSVDAALCSLISRNMPAAELDLFTIEGENVLSPPRNGAPAISYKLLTNQRQLHPYDVILFWGDFLHSRSFHVEHILPRTKIRNPSVTESEFIARIFDTLLLEHAPESVLRKVICFGGSIYFDSLQHAAEDRYRTALSRLYSNARLVMVRDPISAAFAPNYGARGPNLGVDCAFLLHPFASLVWDNNRGDNGAVGYSFNRRLSQDKRQLGSMKRFVDRIAELLECAPVDLQWLKANEADPLSGLSEKLSHINRCRLVVTDTYHCAISALRDGVHTICIGIGAERAADPLSEKKKELLFSMFNASEYYLYFEAIARSVSADKAAKHMAALVNDHVRLDLIGQNIRMATAAAEGRLLNAIKSGENTSK